MARRKVHAFTSKILIISDGGGRMSLIFHWLGNQVRSVFDLKSTGTVRRKIKRREPINRLWLVESGSLTRKHS